MSSTTAFFNPAVPFTNDLKGWEIQDDDPTISKQRGQALGKDGDEIASKTHDEKETVTLNFVAKETTAKIPSVGVVESGYHIDSASVKFVQNDYVKMTLTCHKHLGTGVTSHGTLCRTYTPSWGANGIGIIWGCPDAEDIDDVVVIPSGAGVRSFTYTIQCNHVDESGSQGDFLAGDNYDGSEQAEVEICDTGTITAASGWDLMQKGSPKGNTVAQAGRATLEHHLAHDVNTATLDLESSSST